MAQDSDNNQTPTGKSPYQLYDPTMDTLYTFGDQQEAIEKAKELGSSRFQAAQEDGSFLQINVADAEKEIAGKQNTIEPVVLQEPSERPAERSAEEPSTTINKEPVQTSVKKPVVDQSPESVIEPDPSIKVPDCDDAFSRPNGFDDRFVVTQRRNAQDLYRSYDDKR